MSHLQMLKSRLKISTSTAAAAMAIIIERKVLGKKCFNLLKLLKLCQGESSARLTRVGWS